MNRLAHSTSPYLAQHRDNPVDWWEWGQEAFAEARRRNVPVFLSVGYAACHWCHVMAHESFEDEEVARVLRDGFVAVKVDREERPDIDAVYLSATTAMTGHAGWPMTCLLTPEGEPFWCGTYLPRPQLLQLLGAAGTAWTEREHEVRAGGEHVVRTLQQAQAVSRREGAVTEDVLAGAVAALSRELDVEHGGFGGAPKFPPSMVLAFLQRHHARTGSATAARMLLETTTAMARSGMYDQLGGGFARYAVDAAWVVPHFEKMLYDNALLLGVYVDLLASLDGPDRTLAERVVRDTVGWLLREMRTPEGGFASSLDADTDGVEGATYVWTPAQLAEVLGPEEGRRAATLLGVTDSGTFEHGRSTLQLPVDPADPQWWEHTRAVLLAARAERPQPGRDDKVVTAWNGLLVGALARAGACCDEPEWVDAARRCAHLLTDLHLVGGRLRRSSRDGRVGAAEGVAEDYGNLVMGLTVLHTVTGEARWLHDAEALLSDALDRFSDGSGGFHDTAHDAERLVLRPQSSGDNAEPCGHSALTAALVSYGAVAGSADHLARAAQAVDALGGLARTAPRFAGWLLAAAEDLSRGPLQVAVATGGDAPGAARLVEAARRAGAGVHVVVGEGDDHGIPLLRGRGTVDGAPAAYVCRGTVCDLPVTDVGALARSLPPVRLP
jgi:uncharacterized protein